jgi:type I restriction enzyme S subunit
MCADELSFGLGAENIRKIQAVLAQYVEIEKVMIYGSRAKGNYKPGSDIDLSLFGKALSEDQLLRLENQLDDLMLPYQFDLNRFHSLQNKALIEHIERVGIVLYSRDKTL